MKRRRRQEVFTSLTIGIFGCELGVGVTHLTLALATYTSQFLGVKTTVIECCGQDKLIGMGVRMSDEGRISEDFFTWNGIRFFARAKEQLVAEEIHTNEGIVILDLGHEYNKARPYLLRCDTKILVGSTAPWHADSLINLIARLSNYEEKLDFDILVALDGFVEKKEKKRLRKVSNTPVVKIPFIENPFKVVYEHSKVFDILLRT